MTRLLVYGGRDLDEATGAAWLLRNARATVKRLLGNNGSVDVLISGTARGGDRAGEIWADWRRVEIERYRPDWKQHGRAAGIIRNGEMLTVGRPDCAIGFPGGRGTANMTERLRAANIPYYLVMKHA